MFSKSYYVVVEYYKASGQRIKRMFIKNRQFGCIYTLDNDINKARFFKTKSSAKAYCRNLVVPENAKIIYEELYDII